MKTYKDENNYVLILEKNDYVFPEESGTYFMNNRSIKSFKKADLVFLKTMNNEYVVIKEEKYYTYHEIIEYKNLCLAKYEPIKTIKKEEKNKFGLLDI